MRTTLAINGAPEIILEKAVKLGVAKSRTDAIRLGILSLNKEYSLVKDIEMELVAKKIAQEKETLKANNQNYLNKKEALKKYSAFLK